MDPDEFPVATLLPELGEPLRQFDLTFYVPHEGDGLLPLVPKGRNVTSIVMAEQTIVCVSVRAPDLFQAMVLGGAAAGALARAPGVAAEVKPVPVRST
jgi:hypothetical protein